MPFDTSGVEYQTFPGVQALIPQNENIYLDTAYTIADAKFSTLEQAVAATPPGGVLDIISAWTRVLPLVINQSIALRFRGGSITTLVDSISAIMVNANNVRIENAVLIGTTSATSSTGGGITAIGASAGALITGLRIIHPTISSFTQYGVYLENCSDFRVEDVNISSIAYAGISVASCMNGEIIGGSISNVTMPGPLVNSYGVAVSRRTNSAGELTTFPRSSNITVRKVTVTGVQWEGLDTHGGLQISFIDNTLYGCALGIAIVGSANNAGTITYAALGNFVSGNKIYGNVSNGTLGVGIEVVGTATEKATGIVIGNNIEDMGIDITTSGGMYLELTSGLVAVDNSIKRPANAGILVGPSNLGLGLFNNTVEDVWAISSAICAAVYVKAAPNVVTIGGTQIVRGTKAGTTLINNEGLRCSATSTQIDAGGNGWSNAVTPIVSGVAAHKSAVYGATPVVRAAVITAPTAPSAGYVQAEAAAMKTAVDAIRVALTNYGITL